MSEHPRVAAQEHSLIKAVIFDVDGTLIDPVDRLADIVEILSAKSGWLG